MDEKAHDKVLQAGLAEGVSDRVPASNQEERDKLHAYHERLRAIARDLSQFKLNPDNDFEEEVSEFFNWWRRKNPDATPTEEFREKCLDDAFSVVRPHPSFPRSKFVEAVGKYYDYWSADMIRCGL